MTTRTGAATDTLREQVVEAVSEVKPRLRGWLHAAAAPLALAGGVLLVRSSPPGSPRTGSMVFAACALVLFTVSAAMHRGRWSPRANLVLTRLDHACIFLLIAGSYTPFALLLLRGSDRAVMLCVAWAGADRHRVPAALAGCPAMAVHADLHRPRLDGYLLRG